MIDTNKETPERLKQLTTFLATQYPNEAMIGIRATYKMKIGPREIVHEIATVYGCDFEEILAPGQTNSRFYSRFTAPRATAASILRDRQLGDLSLAKIGEILGGRDHSTIHYTLSRVVKDRLYWECVHIASRMIGVEYVVTE